MFKPCAWAEMLESKTRNKIARIVLEVLKDEKISIFCNQREICNLVIEKPQLLSYYIYSGKTKKQPSFGAYLRQPKQKYSNENIWLYYFEISLTLEEYKSWFL